MNSPHSNNQGYVYVLTNSAMPGLVKVGRSKYAAAGRANNMYSGDTGVPVPFDIVFECLMDDAIKAEAAAHYLLSEYRINPKREFFQIDAEQAVFVVMSIKAQEISHRVVYVEDIPDRQHIGYLSKELKSHPFEIIAAINSMTLDDFAPIF